MQIANGSFKRMAPAKFADKVGIPLGWIVIRHDHLAEKLQRRQTHAKWVKINSGGRSIFRVLRYSANLKLDDIVMDWAGWIDLQGRTDQESECLSLTVSTPRWYEFLTIPFRHVDPAYRLSAWLGAISVALGALSIALTLILS